MDRKRSNIIEVFLLRNIASAHKDASEALQEEKFPNMNQYGDKIEASLNLKEGNEELTMN